MLKLYNKEHVAVASLTELNDYKIEYLLSGEDLLEFSLSICDENLSLVEEEGYIRTKFNEYVIKAIDPSQNLKRFSCIVNIESIKSKSIKNFDTNNNNITDTIRLAIAGTGWILADNTITKRRTVKLKNTDALEVLREVRKVFMIDYRFDAVNKIIYVYEQFGSDKGVYFTDELNLKSFEIPSDTYNYATRLYCYGKEGLNIASINGGKEYIENFQYSNKIIEKIWSDDRYTVIESLKEDAIAKLEELSKPKRSYQADILDLAKISDEYKFLDFFLGDTITLLSKSEKFRDKQRIVKYIEYPKDPSKNTCELGNTTLTFEELQKENESKNKVVDNTTIGNGIVIGSSIDNIKTNQISDFEASVAKITDLTVINADIVNLKAQNVTITGELNTVKANIGTLVSNVATIDSLTVTHSAYIADLQAGKASITQLEAVNATIKVLEADVGKIETLVNGNLSSENIQAGGITSDKLTISNGFIKNAMIDSLDVSKVNAGDISTNKFRIISNDGGIEIVGATQQFKDKNNKVRIQMGKDAQGNFNFIIRGEDGTTTLIDHTGVKSKAIADDLIVNNMIASDAIGEKQINYSSFTNGFNKDTNTNTLKATKIKLDNQNQSLEVAFNSLKTQADGTKTTTDSHSTTINIMQGQINTAINNTQIVKDGQIILLKDDYNRTVETVDSMESTIGSHTTQINQSTGKISAVETRVNIVERNLDSITSRVSSTETKVNDVDEKISATNSKVSVVEQNLSSITSRVSSVETTTSNINGQVVNLSTRMNYAEQKITDSSIISTVSSQFYSKGQSDLMYANKTTFEQTTDKLELMASSSKLNILSNSNGFSNQDWWGISNSNLELRTPVTNTEIKKGFGLANKSTIGIRLSQYVELKSNTTYTFQVTCKEKQINAKGFRFTLQDKDTEAVLYSQEYTDIGFKTFSFTVPKNNKYLLGIWHQGATQYNGSLILIEDLTLVEGTFKFKIGELSSTEDNASITLKANQIVNKVSASQVSSIIEQNPKSVEVAFNNITSNVQNSSGKFIIRRGAIELYNHQDLKCFSMEPDGWLKVWGLKVFGPQNPIQFTGDGDKGIEINANSSNICYIDFSRNGLNNDYVARIAQLPNNGSLISVIGGLEIIPDVRVSSDARLELRSPNLGPVYIDFSHNTKEDYQKRILSLNGDPYLHLYGGLTVHGQGLRVDKIGRNTNPSSMSLYFENNIDMQGLSIYNAVIGSDRNLKHDISYIDYDFKNSCYEFVRDSLKTVMFRYNANIDATTRIRIGLIAQDLYSSKVGRVIQTKNKFGQLGYDDMSYMNVLATALQKVIEDNELLEKKLKYLESKIA